ncbi:alpha/beta hydrolase [Micromonospora sp. NPDC092111]|uniref:alpha/beta hydrolase n=1 Tax=Micromonospora sp. NPDC092111 TaxID=3364289 RepID=UPI003817CF35
MADRRAVLVPGRSYDTHYPLFAYPGEGLRRAGFDVHEIDWQPPAGLGTDGAAPEVAVDWVGGQVAPTLEVPTDLLVGKSLGTLAAPLAAERGLAAVWLTPLLHRPEVVAALGRSSAPFLLVGGTADRSWDGAVARRLTPHVLEVPDADHGLLVPGPLARSAEALGLVCAAVEEFVQVNWPA